MHLAGDRQATETSKTPCRVLTGRFAHASKQTTLSLSALCASGSWRQNTPASTFVSARTSFTLLIRGGRPAGRLAPAHNTKAPSAERADRNKQTQCHGWARAPVRACALARQPAPDSRLCVGRARSPRTLLVGQEGGRGPFPWRVPRYPPSRRHSRCRLPAAVMCAASRNAAAAADPPPPPRPPPPNAPPSPGPRVAVLRRRTGAAVRRP